MIRSDALRLVNLEKEEKNPSGFDMETAIKERGAWTCAESKCRDCSYVRNLYCLEYFGLLDGDPPYDPDHYWLIHTEPGGSNPYDVPKETRAEQGLEIFEKSYSTNNSKFKNQRRGRR